MLDMYISTHAWHKSDCTFLTAMSAWVLAPTRLQARSRHACCGFVASWKCTCNGAAVLAASKSAHGCTAAMDTWMRWTQCVLVNACSRRTCISMHVYMTHRQFKGFELPWPLAWVLSPRSLHVAGSVTIRMCIASRMRRVEDMHARMHGRQCKNADKMQKARIHIENSTHIQGLNAHARMWEMHI